MIPSRDCLVMAKPAGPRCNLRCSYCYYVGKAETLAAEAGTSPGAAMSGELLERYIVQRFRSSPSRVTHFEWHGGEPSLLGLDFFRRVVELQNRHLPPGRGFTNGLQTNGVLIDAAWADFLAREHFSVGLSLDGPPELHDRYRRFPGGEPSSDRVLAAYELLRKAGVFCNLLCVLSRANVHEPDRVYGFFRDLGATYLQFLPLVGRSAPRGSADTRPTGSAAAPKTAGPAEDSRSGVSAATAPAEAIGAFLCRIFDLWIASDVGRIVIQSFDEALRPIHGVEHALCVHRETCGDVAVLERDGSFYMCDHFVDPEHRLGSLCQSELSALANDERLLAFGEAKRSALPASCRSCEVLAFCNGGCPKDRFLRTPEGEEGLNYLCPAYLAFFRHVQPELRRLSAHLKAGLRLREFRAAATTFVPLQGD